MEGKTNFIPELFAKVEDIIKTGQPKQKELAIVGFLEDLQTLGSHLEPGYQPFEKWLGQSSLSEWRHLEVVWAGKSSLMDIVRAETKKG